jgi:isopentenyl-diphosphate Delta-isomerase
MTEAARPLLVAPNSLGCMCSNQKQAVQMWTNTCCSHQLTGQQPEEVDDVKRVQLGHVPGAIAAAARKMEHELGIQSSAFQQSSVVFLTRLLYCAADFDPVTRQPTGWGEHELDYILFARQDVSLSPNPEEVDEVKYVTQQELKGMMHPDSGLRWSPWFRIIAEHFLFRWWDDLDDVLAKGQHADWPTVHELSCNNI